MGCGNSNLDPAAGETEVSTRIRPLLRRRLEEMKKRDHAGVLKGSQNLSKKGLLKSNGSDEDEAEIDVSMKSAKVAPAPQEEEEDEKVVVHEEKKMVVEKNDHHQEEDDKEKVTDVVSAGTIEENKVADDKVTDVVSAGTIEENKKVADDKVTDVVSAGTIEENKVADDKVKGDYEKEEEEVGNGDEESLSDLEERKIGPGSPSFKVYCTNASDSDKDHDKESKIKKNSSEEGGDDRTNSSEENAIKVGSKWEKGWKVVRALRKGRPARHLFSVKSCYNPTCMGHHHTRLPQDKSTL